MCRNDDLDIAYDEIKRAYYVNSIDDSEWLEYIMVVEKASAHQLSITVYAEKSCGKLALPMSYAQIDEVAIRNLRNGNSSN